jgi:hypothetical protein
VTLALNGNTTISGQVASASAVVSALEASIAVDMKSMGHTVAERSCKDADFLCNSCI